MRILVLFAHPVETSFQAALYRTVCDELKGAGHEVDALDLYAENFDPRLTREERMNYHDLSKNQTNVAAYVERVQAAEAMVIVTPVWNFGYPAILKGFFDRVFLPGVSFEMAAGRVKPKLKNIRKLAVVTTYGGSFWRAFLVGDPPRRIAKRFLRATFSLATPVAYLAHYDMNRSTDASRTAFLKKVAHRMTHF